MKKIFFLLTILTLVGCAPIPSTTKYTDKDVYIEKNNVKVGLSVNCRKTQGIGYFDTYCDNLTLFIQNKTNQNIEVNWDKTFFISNNQTHGGFMFSGIPYIARNAKKPNDVVFLNSVFQKVIYPNNLVDYSSGWVHRELPMGDIGVYLTLIIDRKEVDYKLTNQLKIKKEIL
jgi:hypothetical protein